MAVTTQTHLCKALNGSGTLSFVRASDADRDQVADRLKQATAEGRLNTDELEYRLEKVFSSRTYRQLERLTQDLPRPTDWRKITIAGALLLILIFEASG